MGHSQRIGYGLTKAFLACCTAAAMLAACGGGNGSADSPTSTASHDGKSRAAAACSAVPWAYGQFYSLGTVVQYSNGSYYKLVNVGSNGSDGTDPTISTWYWSPTTCTSDSPPAPAPAPSTGSCEAWAPGHFYALGTVVRYTANGNYYKLVNVGSNGSDGTDPTISTWYWSPSSCSSNPAPTPTPNPTPGPSSCETWAAGRFYTLGTVVRYAPNGNYYKLVNVGSNGSDGTDPTISTWYWSPSSCGSSTTPTNPSDFVVSEDQFNRMFPGRGGFYTYAGLVSAARSFPQFTTSGSDTTRKQEAAAFLANINHETGGLVYVDEINTSVYWTYCHPELPYGCPAGVDAYHGRGPIQLSHNFNYKAAGDALGIDLLNHPEWVSTNPEISWKTGIWFWMSSTGAVGTTPHDAMVNGQGFGTTIRVINGGLECNGANPAQVQSRVDAYRRFTDILGVPAGAQLGC